MSAEARVALGLVLGAAVAYWATPCAMALAGRLQFFDQPHGYKDHARPTPYLGGAAVMTGFIVAVFVSTGDWTKTLPLVGGVIVLAGVGTVDDRRNVGPGFRVVVELLLAAGLWGLDLGWNLGLGSGLDLALTCLWVVGVVNAFNLFDNMDGATPVMALAVALGFVAIGLVHGDVWLGATAGALAGACLGFLPHNLTSPARIFLGDGGSMPIGFIVAALAMVGSSEAAPAWQALFIGVLLVGIPLMDTALVVISRRRRGVSFLTGGRDHLTHRTHRRLRSARAVAVALGGVQALVAVLALFADQGGSGGLVAAVAVYVVGAGLAIGLLESEGVQPANRPAVMVIGVIRRVLSREVLAGALGLGAGLSPFFEGFYDSATWAPLGLVVVMLLTAIAIARPPRLGVAAWGAIGGLGGLGLLCLLSTAWAGSAEQAMITGNRYLVLAAVLGAGALIVRDGRGAGWLLGGVGVGLAVIMLSVLFGLLGADPNQMFIGGRLNDPLGYINGQGSVFVMGGWLALAVAERGGLWLSGLGGGSAVMMFSWALLSQSRGTAIGAVIAAAVVLIALPGRLVRALLLALVGAGVALALGSLTDIYHAGSAGTVPASVAHHAAVTVLGVSVLVAVVWTAGHAVVGWAQSNEPALARQLSGAGRVMVALVVAVGLAGGLATAGSVADTARTQWHSFIHLSDPGANGAAASSQSHLLTGAGNRYDYWRVAWNAWTAHPVEGVGAGSYDQAYFHDRSTTEDIRQPHSIEMQTLSELGVLGAALLALFVAGVGLGVWRFRTRLGQRASGWSSVEWVVLVGGLGVAVDWFVQTSVDWIHLLPGVSAVALLLIGLLVRRPTDAADPAVAPASSPRHRARLFAVSAAVGLALVVTALSLSRQGLADYFRNQAQDALAARPADALHQADSSLRLDGDSVASYYVRAAALARFNRGPEASAALQTAAIKEPHNFLTWALLGDLAVRRQQLRLARAYYTRAHELNPRDDTLGRLAADPRSATQ